MSRREKKREKRLMTRLRRMAITALRVHRPWGRLMRPRWRSYRKCAFAVRVTAWHQLVCREPCRTN